MVTYSHIFHLWWQRGWSIAQIAKHYSVDREWVELGLRAHWRRSL